MSESVYKVIELIGTSKESWEKAAATAVERAGQSLRDLRVAKIAELDLQLDAKFISRHHAVILVGPINTVIEDLNSTNGVQVNGRRVTRQTLRDGDQVVIGRAHYRFAVRKPPERR